MIKDMRRRRLLLGVMALVALMGFLTWAFWRSEAFWHLSGRMLLAWAQTRLQGEIRVGHFEGHPLTGLTLVNVVLRTKVGEVLEVARIKLRLSPWSLITLQPVVGYLELKDPRLTLPKGEAGDLIRGILRSRGEESHFPLSFKSLTISEAVVQNGQVSFLLGEEMRRITGLEAQMTLTLLHPGQPQEKLLLRRGWVKADTSRGPVSLTGRLILSREQLHLLSLTMDFRDRSWLTLSGDLRFDQKLERFSAQGEIGPVSGKELGALVDCWPSAFDLRGRFQVQGTLAELQLKVQGQAAEAVFSLEGILKDPLGAWSYKGNLALSQLQPSLLAPFSKVWAEKLAGLSPVTLKGEIEAQGSAWSWEQFGGRFHSDPAIWGKRYLAQLAFTLAGTPGLQQLNATATGNFGRLVLGLKGPLLKGAQGEVRLRVEGLRPGILGLPGSSDDLYTGDFQGTFRLPRWTSPVDLALAGDLRVTGRVGGYPLRGAQVHLGWEKGRWTLSRGEIAWGNLKAVINGAVSAERVELKGEGHLIPGVSGPFLQNLEGPLRWQGSLSGARNSPRLGLQAQGQRLRWQGLNFEGLTLSASLEGWPFRSGSVELKARQCLTPLGPFKEVSLHANGTEGNWRFRARSASGGGQAEMAGMIKWDTRPLNVSLERALLQGNRVKVENLGPLRLRFLPGLEVEPATFKVNGGLVRLEARVRQDEVFGRLEAENIPAGILAVKGQPLEGNLKIRASLGGEARRPIFQGEVGLGPGRLGAFRFHSFTGAFGYQGGRLTLKAQLEQQPEGPRLTLEGQVPLIFSLIPFNLNWGKEDLRLRLSGDRTDLALLGALTPEVVAASGPVNLRMEWQGPASRPQVSGEVRWGEGSLKFRQAGKAYHLRPGVIRLQGDRMSLSQIVLQSRGTATISGEIRLAGFQVDKINLKAQLAGFEALSRVGSEALGNGELFLQGDLKNLALTGRLQVTQASFRSIFFASGLHEDIVILKPRRAAVSPEEPVLDLTGDLLNRLRLDLTLESTGGVWVRDPRFKVEVAGNLKATKKPGESVLIRGQLRALQGTIDIQDRSFKIVEGTLNFPGAPRAPATLSGRALYEMSDVTLVLNFSGPTTSPVLQYSSIPPLPPSDVLAYLLFGRPARALTREEYQVVSPEALGALGGLAAKKLQNFLGKGFPLLGDITFKGDTERMGLSKPLTKDLSISLERKINPLSRDDENQIRLEYRINRHLGVESQMGKRNSGADVIFNFDF